MADEPKNHLLSKVKTYTSGAVGAGLVLVMLPGLAMYYGIGSIGDTPIVGLPVLAIFGIMILFGSLALVATLFARLELSDKTQALALPEGSIRAAIALSLIVLFAIISVMLFQSLSTPTSIPYVITDIGEDERVAVVQALGNSVIAVVPRCSTGAAIRVCSPESLRFAIHVRPPVSSEATDLAKQLLILIGTLMTSVTSFYFASRAGESPRRDESDKTKAKDGSEPLTPETDDADGLIDGCDIPISDADATSDADLPPARGGVA